jgi:type II secretory pathway component PulF
MDPIALIFLGLTFLLLLAAIIIPQMQNRNKNKGS